MQYVLKVVCVVVAAVVVVVVLYYMGIGSILTLGRRGADQAKQINKADT